MTTQKTTDVEKVKKDITVKVLEKINVFKEQGELTLPKDYSPENALKSAYLILSETVDKDKNPVLESCSQGSIANALLSMVTWGLSPIKNQVYFIPYGGKLQISKSYLGNIAIAKRVAGVKEVRANCIYDGDDFDYEIDVNTGRLRILKHKPSFENIDNTKIKGAYAVVIYNDNSTSVEVMNMKQIRTSWEQGQSKGNSPAHSKFGDEMAKKTVINRALKTVIGSSSDAGLYEDNEVVKPTTENLVKQEIEDYANSEIIDFEEVEEVVEDEVVETPTTDETPEVKKSGMQPSMDF
jgi:recombination protein RecT